MDYRNPKEHVVKLATPPEVAPAFRDAVTVFAADMIRYGAARLPLSWQDSLTYPDAFDWSGNPLTVQDAIAASMPSAYRAEDSTATPTNPAPLFQLRTWRPVSWRQPDGDWIVITAPACLVEFAFAADAIDLEALRRWAEAEECNTPTGPVRNLADLIGGSSVTPRGDRFCVSLTRPANLQRPEGRRLAVRVPVEAAPLVLSATEVDPVMLALLGCDFAPAPDTAKTSGPVLLSAAEARDLFG